MSTSAFGIFSKVIFSLELTMIFRGYNPIITMVIKISGVVDFTEHWKNMVVFGVSHLVSPNKCAFSVKPMFNDRQIIF